MNINEFITISFFLLTLADGKGKWTGIRREALSDSVTTRMSRERDLHGMDMA